MKPQRYYFSLRIKGGNTYHENGKRLKLAERLVNIGETADCDIRYNAEGVPPEYYATIIRNEDGMSWRIVKRSQHIDISIAGKGVVGYACQLSDGDIIQIGDYLMALCFHTHYDNRYDEEDTQKNKWPWVALFAVCVVGLAVLALFSGKNEKDICEEDIEPLKASICQIRVDSVKQILLLANGEDSIVRSKSLTSNAPTGTAFLTTDGKIITARHCVEYWLGQNVPLTTKVANLSDDDIVKWAIETETYNRLYSLESASAMQMKVWFSICDAEGKELHAFTSTDSCVHINRERDGVFEMADFDNDYYLRTIRPYFKDRSMAMDDILWIDGVTDHGKITLATAKDLASIKVGTKLMICGYPQTGATDRQMIPALGSIKSVSHRDSENLFFESNINHGYSGGPLLMKLDDRIVAIGVVSCVDSISSGLFKWAVPVTEVNNDKR